MQYRETFTPYEGFRLYRGDLSLVLQVHALTADITDDEVLRLITAINRILDAGSGRNREESADSFLKEPLTKDSFPQVKNEPFYKYISEDTWEYISKGSFQFGSANFYRSTDNQQIQDSREGLSSVCIKSQSDQLIAWIISGYNTTLFCGTAAQNARNDSLMRSRFGAKLICIQNPEAFGNHVCEIIGAKKFYLYDVIYTGIKHIIFQVKDIHRYLEISRSHVKNGKLTMEGLREINKNFFQTFYDCSFMPSLFVKPQKYSIENERRMAFEMEADLQQPNIVINSKTLREMITLIN